MNLATLPFVLDNYRRNPVVLPFHSYLDFPIGRGEIESIDTPAGQALYALASFDIKDPWGELSDRKYRDGFLFAVSLGWDDVDDRGVPVRISKRRPVARDVLEFSVVSVPADTSALIDEGTPVAGRGRRGLEVARSRAFLAEARGVLVAKMTPGPSFSTTCCTAWPPARVRTVISCWRMHASSYRALANGRPSSLSTRNPHRRRPILPPRRIVNEPHA